VTTDMTAYDAMIKDYYSTDKVLEQSYGDNVFFGLVPKLSAGGRRYFQPIEYGNPGGASAVFGTAMRGATSSNFTDFIGTRTKQYQRVLLDRETYLSTERPAEAFEPAFDEFDRGLRSLGEKIAHRLCRTSGGSIGQMATGSATNVKTITLADPADSFNFQIGMKLQFAAADGTGSLRASGTTLGVAAIDRTGGVITTDAAVDLATSISGIGTTDFVFPEGDFGACLQGLADWLPIGSTRDTKLAASFCSVTRSVDKERLGGLYLDGTRMGGIDEILIKGGATVAMHGGKLSHIFMNPMTGADLQILSYSKMFMMQPVETRVSVNGVMLNIGFSGIRATVGGQTVTIYLDRNWPTGRIDMLEMSSWKLRHLGDSPVQFLGSVIEGGRILKEAETEDSVEARIGGYMWLGCAAPGHNLAASVPTS
jgi:hypothetical protein